jgi:hypothetical protein
VFTCILVYVSSVCVRDCVSSVPSLCLMWESGTQCARCSVESLATRCGGVGGRWTDCPFPQLCEPAKSFGTNGWVSLNMAGRSRTRARSAASTPDTAPRRRPRRAPPPARRRAPRRRAGSRGAALPRVCTNRTVVSGERMDGRRANVEKPMIPQNVSSSSQILSLVLPHAGLQTRPTLLGIYLKQRTGHSKK